MFTTTPPAIYRFMLDGITYEVIEDDPNNKDLRVRTVHGVFDFPKEELQHLVETGEAELMTKKKVK